MNAAKMNAKTSEMPRLILYAFEAFKPRFSSSGHSRRSTKLTIGFSRNAITMPDTSGERIFPTAPSSEKKPGRFVKMTTSRMLMKMTVRAVSPHLKYRRSCCSCMRVAPILVRIWLQLKVPYQIKSVKKLKNIFTICLRLPRHTREAAQSPPHSREARWASPESSEAPAAPDAR